MLLLLRALVGGTFVVAFALIGEKVTPKTFSGLFSAAPSIALASLLVVGLAKSAHEARDASLGMIVGSAAMLAYCVFAAIELPRLPALADALAGWAVWLVVAITLGVILL